MLMQKITIDYTFAVIFVRIYMLLQ